MQILNERRVRELDILKGIGIMLIVLGHLEPGTYLMRFIYSFHLFIFFACSGFVGARYKNREIVGIIKENIKRLLLPYLLWCAISQIIALIYDNIDFVTAVENILYINANVGWNAALWFLVSLFWTDSIGAVITKLNKWAYILFLVLSIGVWIIIAQSQVVLPFGLYTVPAGLTFWILGYWVSANKIHQKLKMLSTACKLAGGGVLLVLCFFCGTVFNEVISIYHNLYYNVLFTIIAGFSGFLSVFILATTIVHHNKIESILLFFGQNTLPILCTHYFILRFLGFVSLIITGVNLWRYCSTPKSIVITVVVFVLYYPLLNWLVRMKANHKILRYLV